jgi:hypothetical protein
MKYFLKGNWQDKYTRVTKKQYVDAEGDAGFWPDEPGETATAAFSGHGISGKIEYEEKDRIYKEDDYECF